MCNAESGDAVALYDLKLSDVRKQVRASLPQKAPRCGPSSPSEYGSHPALAQPLSEYHFVHLALCTSPDEYVSELEGTLVVSVAVGSELPTHTEDETRRRDDDNPLVLMPPLVRWTHYSLFVAAYRVEGLPNMDEYSSTHPFIAMKMHGQSALKSSVKNTLNPVFNERLGMPLKLPLLNDTLTLRLADYDQGGYDDLIADVHFSLNEVVRAGTVEPHWRCLYGVYNTKGMKQVRTKSAKPTSRRRTRASSSRFRQEVEKPLSAKSKTIGPCSDQQERYVLRFDLYQVSQLCARCAPDNTQLQLELQCGGLTLTCRSCSPRKGAPRGMRCFRSTRRCCRRASRRCGTRTNRNPWAVMPCPGRARMLEHSPAAARRAQCPDLFLNLNYTAPGSRTPSRLGYIRLNFAEVKGFNHPPTWNTLLRDPLFPQVSAVPGFIQACDGRPPCTDAPALTGLRPPFAVPPRPRKGI